MGGSWRISTLLQKLIGWKTASLYKSPLISISNFLGFKYVYLWLRKNYVDFIRGKSIYFFLHFLCYFETFERTRSQQGFLVFFSVLLFLLVLCGHSVFSSPPQRPMTSDFERFSIPDILILEKEQVFSLLNYQC